MKQPDQKLMQFAEGAEVRTKDNKKVGKIERVVIEPRNNEVSQLIVEKGFLFPEEKVVPIEMVVETNADEVRLNKKSDEIDLPHHIVTQFVPLEEIEAQNDYPQEYSRPLYAYPPLNSRWNATGYMYMPPVFFADRAVVERNVPDGSIVLKQGAEVYSQNGDKVGSIERIFTNKDKEISHFVISQGLFFTHEKLIPVFWVDNTQHEKVKLAVHSDTLRSLPDFNQDRPDLAPEI